MIKFEKKKKDIKFTVNIPRQADLWWTNTRVSALPQLQTESETMKIGTLFEKGTIDIYMAFEFLKIIIKTLSVIYIKQLKIEIKFFTSNWNFGWILNPKFEWKPDHHT